MTSINTSKKLISTAIALAGIFIAPAAQALTLNLNYRGPLSASPHPDATAHVTDAKGIQLIKHMQRAAADWEAIIEDNWAIDINYFYANEDEVPSMTANAGVRQEVTFNGKQRALSVDIKVYDQWDAYFDPTPDDDVEFTGFEQTLLQDLSPQLLADGFNLGSGDASLLEVGYQLVGNSGIAGRFDLLTALRHELGHGLGVTSALVSQTETADGDYDLNPSLVGGAEVGVKGSVEIEDGVPTGEINRSHFEATKVLMSNTGQETSVRRDISATDIFAAVTSSGWQSVNLQRVDYIGPNGNGQFLNNSNWMGDRAPDPTDFVAVRNGSVVIVSGTQQVDSLLVAQDSLLSMGNGDTLRVQETATLGESDNGGEARITVVDGAEINAKQFDIQAGTLTLLGGTARSRLNGIENHGKIVGRGVIHMVGTLLNEGVIEPIAGTLTIEGVTIASPLADLDGGGARGIIDASNGNLQVNIPIPDTLRGPMTIGAGHFIDLPSDWTAGGELTLNGSSSEAAELRGGDVLIRDELFVDRKAVLDVGVETFLLTKFHVPDANDQLTFTKQVTYNGGIHLGDGSHAYEGNVQVNSGRIDVGAIEIGSAGSFLISGGSVTATNIRYAGDDFQLDGGTLEFDKFTGDLVNRAGTLQINQSLLTGSYTQGETATLAVEISGIGEGEFSTLLIDGVGRFNGELSVDLIGNFLPADGDEFRIVKSTGGHTVEDFSLVGPAASLFEVVVTEEFISLLALAPVLAGDYNENGIVDMADYTVWRDNLDAAPGTLPNDIDGGTIGSAQYATWKTNFGAQPAAANVAGQAVPEPRTALLLAGALGILFAARPAKPCPHAGGPCQ